MSQGSGIADLSICSCPSGLTNASREPIGLCCSGAGWPGSTRPYECCRWRIDRPSTLIRRAALRVHVEDRASGNVPADGRTAGHLCNLDGMWPFGLPNHEPRHLPFWSGLPGTPGRHWCHGGCGTGVGGIGPGGQQKNKAVPGLTSVQRAGPGSGQHNATALLVLPGGLCSVAGADAPSPHKKCARVPW